MNGYKLFRKVASENDLDEKRPGLSVSISRVPWLQNPHTFLWNLSMVLQGNIGQYVQYNLLNEDGQIVSTAEVVRKNIQFPFMCKNGIYIGPCFTPPEYRGNGYYPYLIKWVLHNHPGCVCYMLVSEDNISSLKGVSKLDFEQYSLAKRTSLGIYTEVKHV